LPGVVQARLLYSYPDTDTFDGKRKGRKPSDGHAPFFRALSLALGVRHFAAKPPSASEVNRLPIEHPDG
jgi:hypothetical protein